MKNSKLIQVFSQLTSQDARALKKFLRSPFFNQRQDVIELFDYIATANNKLEAEIAFKHLYPKKPFNLSQFRLVMSYLFRLIEKYLAIAEILAQEETCKIQTAKAYRKRNAPRQAQRILKEAITNLHKKEQRNADWYNHSFQMQFEDFQLASAETPTEELNRQELSDTLDIAYLIAKLRQVCLLLSHQAIYKSTFDIGFLDPLIVLLKDHVYLEIPAIAVYYHCYFMLIESDDEFHFRNFKNLLLEKGTIFSASEIRDLYLQAINYCIKRINSGESAYFGEAMDLYKEGLEKNYLLDNGILSRFTYHNIVIAAIKTKDFEWVNGFIHQYKKHLERKYRESSFSFSLAKLAYSQQNYGAALDLLQKSNYRDLLLNLAAKTVLLKIYYETDEFDLLEAHLDAMKNFIRRKRIIGYHQRNYQHIIQFTKRLLNINIFDKKEMKILEEVIKKAEPLTEKEWLLKQLQNI